MTRKCGFTILLWLVLCTTAFAQKTITVGEVAAAPGEKQSGFIHVPAGEDAPATVIPVTVVNGVRPGPVLTLAAGIHGSEYPPILALQILGKELQPEQVSGTVIIVHICHMPAFLYKTVYENPFDWRNLSGRLPGKIDGTSTERIAYQLATQVVDQSDYVIDNHCGDANEDLEPHIYVYGTADPAFDRRILDLATAFGIKNLIYYERTERRTRAPGGLSSYACFYGKPGMVTEYGGVGRTDIEDVNAMLLGNYNVMKHLGMIDGEIADPHGGKRIIYKKTETIRSPSDGIYYTTVKKGRFVQEGDLLGYLTDFFGNRIHEVRAPYDGTILYVVATPPMREGHPMVKIAGF